MATSTVPPRDAAPEMPATTESEIPRASTNGFLVAFVTMALVLLVAEGFFRSSQLEKRIRKGNHITSKYEDIATMAKVDIVTTGDSRMWHGVEPTTVTAALEEKTGKRFVTYNFGVPAGTTPIFAMIAHDVAHRPRPPKLFIIGITPALMSCCDAISAVGTAPAVRPSAVPGLVGVTWQTDVEEAGSAIVLGNVRLASERTEVIAAFRDLAMPPMLQYQTNGWNTAGAPVAAGVQDSHARGRATGYADLMDKRKGARIKPNPPRFLRLAIDTLHAAGVKVLVIGTPQARQLDWYHDRDHTYFEYLDAVKRVTSETNTPFVDLNSFPGLENADFRDGDHLSGEGAVKFSRYLGAEVLPPLMP